MIRSSVLERSGSYDRGKYLNGLDLLTNLFAIVIVYVYIFVLKGNILKKDTLL